MENNAYINGIKVFSFESRDNLLDFIKERKTILIAINTEKILNKNFKLKQIINKNMGYADGVGAVMALKQKGSPAVKIPGVELWLDIIKKFHNKKTFYLLGSVQEVIDQTVVKLEKEYPNINIVGHQNGFLKHNDKVNLVKKLKKKQPDVVFIAQGTPRQEFLMDELIKEYPALYMGLGGSFDVYTGFKKRAPKLFIALNLEWLYRLFKEPIRIRRQLVIVKFLYLLKMKKL